MVHKTITATTTSSIRMCNWEIKFGIELSLVEMVWVKRRRHIENGMSINPMKGCGYIREAIGAEKELKGLLRS